MKFYPKIVTFLALCTFTYTCSESNETTFLYSPARAIQVPITTEKETSDCKMCKAIEQDNPTEFVLARTQHFTILLNLFPYGKGHILIVDNSHGSTWDSLIEEKRNELAYVISITTTCIKKAFKCQGLNIGYNEGRCSGSSILDHLHIHILPRFEHHEKSFLHAITNTQLVQWDFHAIQQLLLPFFADLNVFH